MNEEIDEVSEVRIVEEKSGIDEQEVNGVFGRFIYFFIARDIVVVESLYGDNIECGLQIFGGCPVV